MKNGVWICSALMLSSWAQPSASEPLEACQPSPKSPPVRLNNATQPPQATCVAEPSLDTGTGIEWGDRATPPIPEHLEQVYDDLLKQGQFAAQQERFAQAMNLVAGIPRNSRFYARVQQFREDWSREVVRQAVTTYQQARVAQALTLLKAVPPESSLYSRATELQRNWSRDAVLLNRAIAARKAGDWQGVMQTLLTLEGTAMYQSQSVQALLQQAMVKLYEPDAVLLQIAMEDLPLVDQM